MSSGFKFMGKDPDGKAKALNSDEIGVLKTKISGARFDLLLDTEESEFGAFTHFGANGRGSLLTREPFPLMRKSCVKIENKTSATIKFTSLRLFESYENDIDSRKDIDVDIPILPDEIKIIDRATIKEFSDMETSFVFTLDTSQASSGSYKVQVYGSGETPEQLVEVDKSIDIELTSTSSEYIDFDLQRFKSITLIVRHNLRDESDNGIDLLLRPYFCLDKEFENKARVSNRLWDGSSWVEFFSNPLILPYTNSYGHDFVINSAWTFLDNITLKNFQLRLNASETPTKGTVTILALGR